MELERGVQEVTVETWGVQLRVRVLEDQIEGKCVEQGDKEVKDAVSGCHGASGISATQQWSNRDFAVQ